MEETILDNTWQAVRGEQNFRQVKETQKGDKSWQMSVTKEEKAVNDEFNKEENRTEGCRFWTVMRRTRGCSGWGEGGRVRGGDGDVFETTCFFRHDSDKMTSRKTRLCDVLWLRLPAFLSVQLFLWTKMLASLHFLNKSQTNSKTIYSTVKKLSPYRIAIFQQKKYISFMQCCFFSF